MKIIDVSLVNNESFLLEKRLAYLSSKVDHSIFVEANYTHSGKKRENTITNQLGSQLPGSYEVVRMSLPNRVLDIGNRWAIEEYSRQWAVDYASNCFPSSIIIISDVDEIPSLEQVEALPGELEEKNVVSLPMVVSYQYVNLLDRGGKAFWRKAKALQSDYRSFSVRLDSAPSVGGSPGQHFRYLAHQVPQLAQKHRDYAHAELDVPEPIIAEIYSIANEYDVAPLPLINLKGAGLLTGVGVSEMSAPAKFIAKSEPRLFKEEIKKELFVTRIAASYQISKLYAQKPDGIQFAGRENESWAMVLSGLSFQVLAHLGFMTIWRAVRRIILNRRPLPRQRLVHFLRGVNLFGDWEIQKYNELGNLQVMRRSWTES